MIATTPILGDADRAEIVAALLNGVTTIRGQQGYQRALAGFAEAGVLERIARSLGNAARDQLRHPAITAGLKQRESAFVEHWRRRAQPLVAEASSARGG